MISDDDLYKLAVFLGSLSMLLIVLYHFLEVNAKDDTPVIEKEKAGGARPTAGKGSAGAKS